MGIYMLWCVGLGYGGGRDLNWDTLNYHLYVPSLIHRPLSQDFMAASIQSYLNPGSLLPFYGMVQAGWPAVTIMVVLALLHSLNLILLHLITHALLPRTMPWRWAFCILAALLGGSTALFWTELGTSFNDVICSLPVLAAIACHVLAPQARRTGWTAGAFIGVAIGLKLTALPWFAALGVMWMMGGGPDRWIQAARFGLGALMGFLLINGWWAARLFHEFGNPFFPFFNEFFRSTLSPAEPLVHRRFMPVSLGALWAFPWQVALASATNVYTENFAVDFRPAMLVLTGGALLLKLLASGDIRVPQDEGRTLLMILGALLFYYISWIMLSGNGRYAMAWLLMLGPTIVACWVRLRRGLRWASYGVVTLLGLQVSSNALGAVQRWASTPWPDQWFSPSVPLEWARRPHLFLSLQSQSYSFLSHFVHGESSFVNLLGQVPIRRQGGEWLRVSALLTQHAGHVRTLVPPAALGPHLRPVTTDTDRQKALLAPYGLTIDSGSCQTLIIDPLSDHPALANLSVGWAGLTDAGLIVSCVVRALNAQEVRAALPDLERLKMADKVFESLERQCPALTGRRSSVTTYIGGNYRRFYTNTDSYITLYASDGTITIRGFDGAARSVSSDCVEARAMDNLRFAVQPPPMRGK